MMHSAKKNADKLMEWLYFGGSQTLSAYQIGDDLNWAEKVDPAHWKFNSQCNPYYEHGNYIFVHAGLNANMHLKEQNESRKVTLL